MKFDEFKIKQICDKYKIENYTIVDGLVNVNGDVDLYGIDLKKLPVKFGIVTGNFYCGSNNLTDLKGSPKEVHGNFSCGFNYLTDLKGSPNIVRGDFSCINNKLTSLEGSPKEVGGIFSCYSNDQLISLKGAPDLIERSQFVCSDTPIYSIFQSSDPKLIGLFNMIFESGIDLPLIEYWFSIIDKPLTDDRLEEIKKHYEI
jgi:hypothetical protein